MKAKCPNCEKNKKKHEYQDEKNGLYIREMNENKDGNLKCTVCGELLKK